MAEHSHITHEAERAALLELMLCCAPYLRSFGRGRNAVQARLLVAVNAARAITRHPVPRYQAPEETQIPQTPTPTPVICEGIPTDPETLFRAYLHAGGNWRDLVAAVNRFSGEASYLRYQLQKESNHE